MTPLRTWSSTNGSIIRCSTAIRLIQVSGRMDIIYFALGPHPQRLPPLALRSRRSFATTIRSVHGFALGPHPQRLPPLALRSRRSFATTIRSVHGFALGPHPQRLSPLALSLAAIIRDNDPLSPRFRAGPTPSPATARSSLAPAVTGGRLLGEVIV